MTWPTITKVDRHIHMQQGNNRAVTWFHPNRRLLIEQFFGSLDVGTPLVGTTLEQYEGHYHLKIISS